jgi:hypothetical protein
MQKYLGFDKASGKDRTVTGRFKNNNPIAHDLPRTTKIQSKPNFDSEQMVSMDFSKIEKRVIAYILKSSSKK